MSNSSSASRATRRASRHRRTSTQPRRAAQHRVHGLRLRRLSAERREALARKAANASLAIFGIKDAEIRTGTGARSVTIGISGSKACLLPRDAPGRIVGSIRQAAPWVRRVHLTIAGSSQSLSSYRSHCHAVAPPQGSGARLLAIKGRGFYGTDSFKVTGRRWTVSWVNLGGFLSVQAKSQGEPTPDFLYSTSPGSGKKTFTDGPGKFSLLINGPAWMIEVYDG